MQRYLLIAGRDSKEAVRWGILTDGAQWRLYSYRANPPRPHLGDRSPTPPGRRHPLRPGPGRRALHQLRIAYLLLRRDSWIPADGSGESLLDQLLAEGRRADERIADDLSDAIFQNVYPELVAAFWDAQPDATAEAVGATPSKSSCTACSSFPTPKTAATCPSPPTTIAPSACARRSASASPNPASTPKTRPPSGAPSQTCATWSTTAAQRWACRPTTAGSSAAADAWSTRSNCATAVLAPIIKPLSHNPDSGQYISYRTLSIQQLGSIYERLLERTPYRDPDTGAADVRISPYARKDSGSYYTPQELVDLIVEQTLQPLVDEKIEAFRADPTPANDPAEAVLRLRVLDPAMGSGHFLLTVIDWLAEQVLDLLATEWEHAPRLPIAALEPAGRCAPPDRGNRHRNPRPTTAPSFAAWC